MAHSTGTPRSVEKIIGHSSSNPNGDNDRPYGKCYGQVCGQSYPCTQQEYIDPRKAALQERKRLNKEAYQRAKRSSHGPVPVVCVETGDVYDTMTEAAAAVGVSKNMFVKTMRRNNRVKAGGLTFVRF